MHSNTIILYNNSRNGIENYTFLNAILMIELWKLNGNPYL